MRCAGTLPSSGSSPRAVPGGVSAAVAALHEGQDRLLELARQVLHGVIEQMRVIGTEIAKAEQRIMAWHRASRASQRLTSIPGIGPITASAIAAAVPEATLFRSGRQFAAWLGLTPRPHSSGGKQRLGGISKQSLPRRRPGATAISGACW